MTEHWSQDYEFSFSDLSKAQSVVPEPKHIREIYKAQGPRFFKELYSMDYTTFQRFADLLVGAFIRSGGDKCGVPMEMSLAVAIRCFRGSDLFTCAHLHGLTRKQTYDATAYIVDAIHLFLQENKIKYKKGIPMIQKVRNLVKSHVPPPMFSDCESTEEGDY